MKILQGKRVLLPEGISSASISIENGRIVSISRELTTHTESNEVIDAGDDLIMPGVVDSHVHVNEPGRTEWEGFYTATKAAAAGGITTIVDMPLNSIPSTTSLPALKTKLDRAAGQCFVDVAFWGGVVPNNENELNPMIEAGVCGFKCFLIHSGVDDFQHVTEDDLHIALKKLQASNTVLLFHAEVDCQTPEPSGPPKEYETFLSTRPDEMEVSAIKLVCQLCLQYKVRCHIVHLSSAQALPIILEAKAAGAPITVETTHHYLCLDAESTPNGATQYKCCPPIRNQENQKSLWNAVKSGDIDMVVSDHSPCTANLKLVEDGDFLKAWGGISSVQFGLSLFWTKGQEYGITLSDVCKLLCENTAKLAGLSNRKGSIKIGLDADFVIWNPDKKFKVTEENIHHKNKLTPYLGNELLGTVEKTIVRGLVVYDKGEHTKKPLGQLLLKN